jgi:diguanylate cyclase (GGDEF)-like protein
MRSVTTTSKIPAGPPGGSGTERRAQAWTWFVAVGVAVTVGYYVLPVLHVARAAQSLIFIAVSAAAAIAVLAGVRVNKPAGRLPWLVLAAAQGMFSIGAAIGFVGYTALADVFSLARYPLIGWALVIFVRRRTPGRDTITLIDAAVVAVAGGLVSWVYVISGLARDDGSPLAGVVAVAYPMMDLLVLAVALHLMLGVGSRTASYRLLIASLSCQLAVDSMYALTIGSYSDGGPVDTFWFGAYVLLGAAALHPSMRSLDRRSPRAALRPTRGRLALLAVAALLPLVVLVVQHVRRSDTHIAAVALSGGVTFLLVLARMAEQVAAQRVLAIRDGLTGAYTVDFLAEAMRIECDRARYTRGGLAVLLVGIDNLKLINDTYGPTGGDLVLRELAERMRMASRPGDLVARHSGDWFALLLAGADSRLAAQTAERVRAAVSATPIVIGSDARIRVTVSIGLAGLPADGVTAHDLLHSADQAMYVAKRAGRNRVYSRYGPVNEPMATGFMIESGARHLTAHERQP